MEIANFRGGGGGRSGGSRGVVLAILKVLWSRHVTKQAGRVSKEINYNRLRVIVARMFFSHFCDLLGTTVFCFVSGVLCGNILFWYFSCLFPIVFDIYFVPDTLAFQTPFRLD